MRLILDVGALVGVDRDQRDVMVRIRVAQRRATAVHTSAAVVAQVWRDGARQAGLARVLAGVQEHALDQGSARSVGRLLRESGTSDVVDAHVALLAEADDVVLTSDEPDIQRLLDARQVKGRVVRV